MLFIPEKEFPYRWQSCAGNFSITHFLDPLSHSLVKGFLRAEFGALK